MNHNLTIWFEILFDVAYLSAIWLIIIRMTIVMPTVSLQDRPAARLIRLAFILLAAGDTGHVGLRVIAALMGSPEAQVKLFGTSMSLVGLGMLTTAYTVTFFYMVFVFLYKERFQQPDNWITYFLLGTGLVRLIFMALPGNKWGSAVPPQPMSIYRNLPLILQGIGILFLFFREAYKRKDSLFTKVAWLITASFAFYLPVILFAQQIPIIGLLMIPKTIAYLAIAWLFYQIIWKASTNNSAQIDSGTAK